jgi:catechol-2,3-dioxygenase
VAVPDRELLQIFLTDPDGNEVELVFDGEEARRAIAEGATVDRTKLRPQEAPDPA